MLHNVLIGLSRHRWIFLNLDIVASHADEKIITFHIEALLETMDKLEMSELERRSAIESLKEKCLAVYYKQLDAENSRYFQLVKSISDCQIELDAICDELGEPQRQITNTESGLQNKLHSLTQVLEQMRRKKKDRWDAFNGVIDLIEEIPCEIRPADFLPSFDLLSDKPDLSLKKLDELKKLLQIFEKEKIELENIGVKHLNILYSLCETLDEDFVEAIFKNDSDLELTIENLQQVKRQRLQKLQDLQLKMLDLWDYLGIAIGQQHQFQHLMENINSSVDEVKKHKSLSLELLNKVESETRRLEMLKLSKMKDREHFHYTEMVSSQKSTIDKANKWIDTCIEETPLKEPLAEPLEIKEMLEKNKLKKPEKRSVSEMRLQSEESLEKDTPKEEKARGSRSTIRLQRSMKLTDSVGIMTRSMVRHSTMDSIIRPIIASPCDSGESDPDYLPSGSEPDSP